MFCRKCGAEIEEDIVFCGRCGNKIIEDEKIIVINSKLTECTACGHMISVEAEICPNCGMKTEYGVNNEHFKEVQQQQREEVMVKTQMVQALEQRKMVKLIISLICTVMFFYGFYKLASDSGFHWYMMVEWGVVTSTASFGLTMIIVSVIIDIINSVTYKSQKRNYNNYVSSMYGRN